MTVIPWNTAVLAWCPGEGTRIALFPFFPSWRQASPNSKFVNKPGLLEERTGHTFPVALEARLAVALRAQLSAGRLVPLAGAVLVVLLLLGRSFPPLSGQPPAGDPDWQGEKIDRQVRLAITRLKRKLQVSRSVSAGRLTLLEAAALFRALEHEVPAPRDPFRCERPGQSEEEHHCRQVIGWVHEDLGMADPRRAQKVRDLLEGQLQEHLRRGALRLPDACGLPDRVKEETAR
jgi:hypothetical protein